MDDGIVKDESPEASPQIEDAPAEENVSGLMPEVEHAHAPHSHGSGIPWLDVIVTVSVVFISVISLVVSIEHGKSMEKMVDQNQKLVVASTMPILSIFWRELDDAGKPMLQETISNGGVGPAIIDRFEVRYKGVVYTDESALLHACCAASYLKAEKSGHTRIYYSNISGFIVPARQDMYPITIKPDKDALDLYSDFRNVKDSDDITYHACYCSVLN